MERIKNLIAALELCIPELEIAPLYANLPVNTENDTVLEWLYQHLTEQNLMFYEEWKEYNGYIPELKPLANLTITEEPADFIFSLIEQIDWSTSVISSYELIYVIPWLEHINFYLKPHSVRLIDLMPFENAYILCVRDNEELLEVLNSSLEEFGISINERCMMDRQQVSDSIESMITG